MGVSDTREIRTMRNMAWERAKGELNSVLVTYWDDDEKYQPMKEAIEEFVNKIEGEALQE
jgi:hypothetical protein